MPSVFRFLLLCLPTDLWIPKGSCSSVSTPELQAVLLAVFLILRVVIFLLIFTSHPMLTNLQPYWDILGYELGTTDSLQ